MSYEQRKTYFFFGASGESRHVMVCDQSVTVTAKARIANEPPEEPNVSVPR